MEGKGRRVFRNIYKGHISKTKREARLRMGSWDGCGGRKGKGLVKNMHEQPIIPLTLFCHGQQCGD